MSYAVVIAAAGKSTRFGDPNARKPFVKLGAKAVWEHSLAAFRSVPSVEEFVVVVSPEDRDWFVEAYSPTLAGVTVVDGGDSRAESVGNGIAAVKSADFIAVHDAARPLVSASSIAQVFAAAERTGAAILASPVTSTVKKATSGRIETTVPREQLWLAQTPQVARRDWFRAAYADREGAAWQPADPTDEAQLLERCGYPVEIVESSPTNFKITTQDDLIIAQALVDSIAGSKS